MEDKIVEIARFYEPEAAQMIESLLKSEGGQLLPEKRIYEPDPIPGQCGRHPHRTA